MKFLIIVQPDQWNLSIEERTIEADRYTTAENGTLTFYEVIEDGEIISMLACFAHGCWHSVFRILDDGSIAMRPVGVQSSKSSDK